MLSSVVSMFIAFSRSFCPCEHFRIRQFIENRHSNQIYIIVYLNLTIRYSCLDVSWVGWYLFFELQKIKINDKMGWVSVSCVT